jgi:hypothetical protein
MKAAAGLERQPSPTLFRAVVWYSLIEPCDKLKTISSGAAMSSAKQKAAAKRNVKKAAATAKRKKTIGHLSKATRTALGKQGAKVAKEHSARG